MTHAIVTITGSSPLLMHKFPMVPIEALEKKSIQEQAELVAYRDPETEELYIPGTNIQRSLVASAAFSKGKGRGSLQKSVAACVFVTPERVSLNTKVFTIDSRPVVVPATKGRIMRHRPSLMTWAVEFTVEWDPTLLTAGQMRRVVDDSGSRVGLLDFRPEKKGSFGRFVVTSWVEKSDEKG
jgi:hypothetical protein